MKNLPESLFRCRSCRELVDEYDEPAAAYSDAGKRLMDCIAGQELDLYVHLRDEFQELGEQCRQLRQALVAHFATHRS